MRPPYQRAKPRHQPPEGVSKNVCITAFSLSQSTIVPVPEVTLQDTHQAVNSNTEPRTASSSIVSSRAITRHNTTRGSMHRCSTRMSCYKSINASKQWQSNSRIPQGQQRTATTRATPTVNSLPLKTNPKQRGNQRESDKPRSGVGGGRCRREECNQERCHRHARNATQPYSVSAPAKGKSHKALPRGVAVSLSLSPPTARLLLSYI